MKVEVVALHRSGHLKNEFEISAGTGFGCREASDHGRLSSMACWRTHTDGSCALMLCNNMPLTFNWGLYG